MTVEQLGEVLKSVGTPVSPLELAEILWLSAHLTSEGPASELIPTVNTEAAEAPEPAPSEARDQRPGSAASTESGGAARHGLHTEQGTGELQLGANADEVLVPTARMLDEVLGIQRALRPLKRRVPSARVRVFDEDATAHQIAALEADFWLPVMRPSPERWMSLVLLVDSGPSMRMWRSLGRELHEALIRLGAFREVRVFYLNGTKASATPSGVGRELSTLIDPGKRQAVLVLSDCSGPHWWTGDAQSALVRLAAKGPLAIIQPLAERLWRRTPLPPVPGLLTAPKACAPNIALRFSPYDGDPGVPPGAIPVPVLGCRPRWLRDWAQTVAGDGGSRPAAIAYLIPGRRRPPPVREQALPPVDARVKRFHASASEEAVLLAAHVAVSFPYLPVMRLIQKKILRTTRPEHLAELLLSGLLRPRDAERGAYEFVDGARGPLLSVLPRSEAWHTADILTRVSREIEQMSGRSVETFRALYLAADGGKDLDGGVRPFAMVSPEALRLITYELSHPPARSDAARVIDSARVTPVPVPVPDPEQGPPWARSYFLGRYTRFERISIGATGESWLARDGAGNEVVAKKMLTPVRGRKELKDRLLQVKRLCRRVYHPSAVRLLDIVDDGSSLWAVMELAQGTPLGSLLETGPLDVAETARLGLTLIESLREHHAAGLRHGGLTINNVMVDGEQIRVTGFGITAAYDDDPTVLGTLGDYISPERARGAQPSMEGDLWSLAVTLYVAVEGRWPFPLDRGRRPRSYSGECLPPERAGPLTPLLLAMLDPDPKRRRGLTAVQRSLENLPPGKPTALPQSGPPRGPLIAVLGARSSGKTTFLAALRITTNAGYTMIPTDPLSADFLVRAVTSITSQGEFPSISSAAPAFEWEISRARKVIKKGRFGIQRQHMVLSSARIRIPDPTESALADGLIFLYDPTSDVSRRRSYSYFESCMGTLTNDGFPRHLAVCITKIDQPAVFEVARQFGFVSVSDTAEQLPEIPDHLAADFLSAIGGEQFIRLVRRHFPEKRVGYFAVSSIGFYVDPELGQFRPSNYINVGSGEQSSRIRGRARPLNVLEAFAWLTERITPDK